jgi:hypothetical protein
MADLFAGMLPALDSPYIGGFAIAPGGTVFPQPTRAIFVGGAGNLALITTNGSAVTLTGVSAGTELRIRATQVLAGTTATNITGLY